MAEFIDEKGVLREFRVYPCPNCQTIVNNKMTQCPSCSSPLDSELLETAVSSEGKQQQKHLLKDGIAWYDTVWSKLPITSIIVGGIVGLVITIDRFKDLQAALMAGLGASGFMLMFIGISTMVAACIAVVIAPLVNLVTKSGFKRGFKATWVVFYILTFIPMMTLSLITRFSQLIP